MMRATLKSRSALALLALASLITAPRVFAQIPMDAELGRDVGDGQVLYNAPYDPKDVKEVTFVAPAASHPYYEIVVPLGDWSEGKAASFKKVTVNGLDCESYYVFVDGFAHVQSSSWLTKESANAKNVVVVARMLWHNNEAVKVDFTLDAQDAEGKAIVVDKSFSGKAPAKGGGPEGWRRYQSVLLQEKAGVDRTKEPVEFSVTARKEQCGDLAKELRVYVVDEIEQEPVAIPFQTFNQGVFQGTPNGTSNDNYLQHPSQFIEVVAFPTVSANQERVLLVCYDNPAAEAPGESRSDLKVTGESLGALVENDFFAAQLDKKSGQIASFTLKGGTERPVLTNSLNGALHWNPDSFSDNGLWGHSFSWNPPERTVVTARGPLMFRITNSGRMPGSTPQVWTSVTYTFYAWTPYVKCTTSMEVRESLNASAIRNGEVVLDTHLVDHFVWQEKSGQLKRMRTMHGPNWQDEWATRIDADAPWLALTNEEKNYGIGAVTVDLTTFNPNSGEANMHRSAYYLYYHHFWGIPLTYFTRGLVYPFSDYQRGPIITVRPGSTYVEKMAFVPFHLGKDPERYQSIIDANKVLTSPLEQRWGR